MLGPGLDEDYWALAAALADADKGGAVDPGMLIEDGFAGDGEKSAAGRDDAMGFAAAEPEAVVFQISDVAHAMPEGCAVAGFVEGVGFRAGDVFGGNNGTADDELADFAGRQLFGLFYGWNGVVDDADDFPFNAGKVAADASAGADG